MVSKITLIGHLGKDPELQVTSEGTPVTKFSIAVNRYSKLSNGERKEETDWYNIVAWRQLAETCEKYLHKGSKVYIEGRLALRKYTDKNGIERMSIDVTANDMQMLDTKSASGASQSYSAGSIDDHDPFLDYPDGLS